MADKDVRRARPAIYHDPAAASSEITRHGASWCHRLALCGSLLVAAGCATWDARIALVSFDATRTGTKMLRPAARATVCRSRVFGRATSPASPLDDALRSLRALDSEADALTNVQIETREFTLGFFDRSCVVVRADVVRTISLVQLPAPPYHHDHH